MISLFEKNPQGKLVPLSHNGSVVFSSLEEFQKAIHQADQAHAFDQLILVGTNNDIGWIHVSLPQSVTRTIVAEINYPLLSAWFKQSLPMPTMTHMLEAMLMA
jgi:hypothetical protein